MAKKEIKVAKSATGHSGSMNAERAEELGLDPFVYGKAGEKMTLKSTKAKKASK